MSNPTPALKNTYCDECGEIIPEGDDVFFDNAEKLCTDCAEDNGNICQCRNYKNSNFEECYECANL